MKSAEQEKTNGLNEKDDLFEIVFNLAKQIDSR